MCIPNKLLRYIGLGEIFVINIVKEKDKQNNY